MGCLTRRLYHHRLTSTKALLVGLTMVTRFNSFRTQRWLGVRRPVLHCLLVRCSRTRMILRQSRVTFAVSTTQQPALSLIRSLAVDVAECVPRNHHHHRLGLLVLPHLQSPASADPNISVVQNVELNDCCGICNRTVGCAVSVWSTFDNDPKSNGSCVTKSSWNSPCVLSFHGASFLPSGAPIPAPVIQDQAGLIVGDMKLVVGTASTWPSSALSQRLHTLDQ
eukprot:m.92873 g.92873  ORF g.92873 m.92873 type:complete len:223 (-) comp12086_c0_seq2:331-999(-)